MSFLFPIFLVGALTAFIPVIIHLIHRKRAPEILFSTLRFLKICTLKTARRKRIEDLLLLLLRILILTLLAFALARPIIKSSVFGSTRRNSVIIVDNSMSMACRHQGRQRFDEAKEVALSIIKEAEGDMVALLFTNGAQSRVKRGLTSKLDTWAVLLAESTASGGQSSIPRAITRAREILNEAKVAHGEIFVISDNQEISWEAALPPKKDPKLAAPVVVYNCGRSDFTNLAVTKIDFGTRAKVTGNPVDIKVTVLNSGETSAEGALSLIIDNRKVLQKSVELEGETSTEVLFQRVFDAPGLVEGFVELSPDSLEQDNYRYFSLNIAHQLKILLVKGAESAVPYLSPDFYLKFALNPKAEPERSKYPLQPTSIGLSALSGENLNDYGLVFVIDAGELSINDALALQDYVAGGGSVVFVMGPGVKPEKYNELFMNVIRTTDVLVPGRLKVAVKKDPGRKAFWEIARVDFEHPFFAPFKDIGMEGFRSIHVYQYMAMEVDESARVLIALDNGAPLLVEKNFGKGKAFFFTTSLEYTWTNFPLVKIFLPVIQSMAFNLAGQGTVAPAYVEGEDVVIEFPERKQLMKLELTNPDNFTRVVEPTKESPWKFVLQDVFATGVYYYKSDAPEAPTFSFVVNPDGEESKLKQIPEEQIRKKVAPEAAYFVSDMKALNSKMREIREGSEWEDRFLIVVLLIILAECYFANRYRPQEVEREAERRHA